MTRAQRKKEARTKIRDAILEINDFFADTLEETLSISESVYKTNLYFNEKMVKNPQESHIWSSAAYEWAERLVNFIKGAKNDTSKKSF